MNEHLSASSRMTTLCRPGGRVTFFWANILILFRTTSMPLQRDLSASCYAKATSVHGPTLRLNVLNMQLQHMPISACCEKPH